MIFAETPVSDGLHTITAMLIVGLSVLALIGFGELVRTANHRRHVRKERARL